MRSLIPLILLLLLFWLFWGAWHLAGNHCAAKQVFSVQDKVGKKGLDVSAEDIFYFDRNKSVPRVSDATKKGFISKIASHLVATGRNLTLVGASAANEKGENLGEKRAEQIKKLIVDSNKKLNGDQISISGKRYNNSVSSDGVLYAPVDFIFSEGSGGGGSTSSSGASGGAATAGSLSDGLPSAVHRIDFSRAKIGKNEDVTLNKWLSAALGIVKANEGTKLQITGLSDKKYLSQTGDWANDIRDLAKKAGFSSDQMDVSGSTEADYSVEPADSELYRKNRRVEVRLK